MKLQTKVLLLVEALILLLALSVSVYFQISFSDTMMNELERRATSHMQTLAFNSQSGVSMQNGAQIKEVMEGLAQDSDLRVQVVYDADGKILVEKNLAKYNVGDRNIDLLSVNTPGEKVVELTLMNGEKVLDVQKKIFQRGADSESKLIGYARLAFSLAHLEKVKAQTTIMIVVVTLVFIAVGLVLALLFQRIIVKSILALKDATKKVAEGHTDVSVRIDQKDEIGEMGDAFNTMVENIRQSLVEIQRQKEGAEHAKYEAEQAKRNAVEQQHYLETEVDRLSVVVEQVTNGDLTQELQPRKNDEIGRLTAIINRMIADLRGMLLQVGETTTAVASASAQISSSTEEMAAGAQTQTSQAMEIASAIEEMTETITENSKNTELASESTRQNSLRAQEGAAVAKEMIVGIHRIAYVVNQSAQTIVGLGKSSDQIGEIIQVIEDIADQTNLLALNAAIEAARAGEQGRGFAVVADEVRKLAERTTKATKEIAQMIKKIQVETKNAVNAINEGTREVDNGAVLAERVGVSLKEMTETAERAGEIVRQIAAASSQQSSTSGDISQNVQAMSAITQETAQGTQQIARAAEDLNKLTQHLQKLVTRFKLESSQLQTQDGARGKYAVRPNGKIVPRS
ncbi:MAG: methyl-accepting chemotaxis protein [Bacteroidota bacterium]